MSDFVIPDLDDFIARCRQSARRIFSEHNAANADLARPLTRDEQMAAELGVLAGIQSAIEEMGVRGGAERAAGERQEQ